MSVWRTFTTKLINSRVICGISMKKRTGQVLPSTMKQNNLFNKEYILLTYGNDYDDGKINSTRAVSILNYITELWLGVPLSHSPSCTTGVRSLGDGSITVNQEKSSRMAQQRKLCNRNVVGPYRIQDQIVQH